MIPKDIESLLKQINLAEQSSAAITNRSAPRSDEEAASRQQWKFWDTQPVPKSIKEVTSDNNGPVEPNKPIEELRQDPYNLPDGFSWDEVDVVSEEQVRPSFRVLLESNLIFVEFQLLELYVLLNENYVEDDDNMFRFDYSMPFLRW